MTYIIGGRANGTTQDVLIGEFSTLYVYSLQYDTLTNNGALVYLPGDRAAMDDITGMVTGSGAAGRMTYWSGASAITSDVALTYDAVNHSLAIDANNRYTDDAVAFFEPGFTWLYYYSDARNPFIFSYRARGTAAAPTALQSGDIMMRYSAAGRYDVNNWSAGSRARMDYVAAENWSVGNEGTRIDFWTTPTGGSIIPAVVAQLDNLGIKNVITNTYRTKDYTLTIPATGTAALLGTANTFTANQTVAWNVTDPVSAKNAINVEMKVVRTGDGGGGVVCNGLTFLAYQANDVSAGANQGYLVGISGIVRTQGAGSDGLSNAIGADLAVTNLTPSTSLISTAIGLRLQVNPGTGSIWSAIGATIICVGTDAGAGYTAIALNLDASGARTNTALVAKRGLVIINENGDIDSDTRIESDTEANMVFLDAGIDTLWFGGNVITAASKFLKGGLFYPVQAPTASPPTYAIGAMYFDTTLNKLRVGGAAAWETVTSV